MKAGDFIVIYVTCANVAEAEKISTALLDEKLIACANVFAGKANVKKDPKSRSS